MKGEKEIQHIVKLSSEIIHLKYTEYIFIHSFNKYLLDTHYVFDTTPGLRDTEKKKNTAV